MLGDKEATHLRLIVPFVAPLSHLWCVSGFDAQALAHFVLLGVANVAFGDEEKTFGDTGLPEFLLLSQPSDA